MTVTQAMAHQLAEQLMVWMIQELGVAKRVENHSPKTPTVLSAAFGKPVTVDVGFSDNTSPLLIRISSPIALYVADSEELRRHLAAVSEAWPVGQVEYENEADGSVSVVARASFMVEEESRDVEFLGMTAKAIAGVSQQATPDLLREFGGVDVPVERGQ
ncbi:MAG: hypothetical protein GY720_19675 [bacterium]|nr:hypothetical protein [bacterium]